jgi:hypothetical protein
MLPEWDFGGDDAKRAAFVSWVWDELDRFALILSDRDALLPDRDDWADLLRDAVPVPRSAGRPVDEWGGMNAMVWEFGLLRYMFRRYWPGKKRRIADSASAASIAVSRCQRAIPTSQRTTSRLEARRDLAARVFEEWERGSRSPGRVQAEADIAFLEMLPANRFAG